MCITQKLILSSSKLPIEPAGAVYHVREEGRHLFGLWDTACNSMTKEYSNRTGCLQIRRVGRAPKQPCFMADGPSALFQHTEGWRKAGCVDGSAGWQGMPSPRPKGPQDTRGLLIWWGPSPMCNLHPAQLYGRWVWWGALRCSGLLLLCWWFFLK